MTSAQPLTVGPVPFATIDGDVFEAVSKRLAALGSSWTELATLLGQSRQNLQRAVRLQQALRFEVLLEVLDGLRALANKPVRQRMMLHKDLADMGLQLTINMGGSAALLEAASLVTRARKD